MAQLITTYRSPRLTLKGKSLLHMVKAIGKPGSNITPDIVCQLIDNCDLPEPDKLDRTFELATETSLGLMQRIHTHFNLPYMDWSLTKAVQSGHVDIALHLASQQTDEAVATKAALKLIAWHPITMDNLTLILDTLPFVKSNPEICAWAVCNPSFEVFKHIISLFTNEQLEGTDHLQDIFYQALIENNSRYLEYIQQRFANTEVEVPELDAQSLMNHINNNHYLFIEKHLDSPSFTDLPTVNQLRTLHAMIDYAYQMVTTRIIKLCKDRINKLDGTYVRQQDDHDQEMDIDQPKASLKLESTLHMVMRDEKLGKMIMSQIGSIHNKHGIDRKQVITGKQLLYNHNLREYIKYGATEWFLQSYNDNGNKLRLNKTLLLEAFARCDTRAMNVLLANPLMCLNGSFDKHFVTNVSSCSHPHWESVLERYVLTLDSLQPAGITISGNVLAHVRHPSFLRKLIEMDIQLSLVDDDGDRNKSRWGDKTLKSSFTEIMVDASLKQSWAVEMLQLMLKNKLLTTRTGKVLLLKAIELNITPVVEILVSQSPGDGDDGNEGDNGDSEDAADQHSRYYIKSLIKLCCQHGNVESLNLVMAHVPSPHLDEAMRSLTYHCSEAVSKDISTFCFVHKSCWATHSNLGGILRMH
ncbi:hypothetical protein SAMD00019534_094260 [Acytostelium subglobosum LB1]|uniref:hypothetical protein n=1 Tax=Acytostelium subglobosum LB1 TaxID=1410327 RepID=UPI000644CA9B|nr:hypothetical protein SAMD00019534_094260 [Acytostelium subglobosum LB1]GAM26251.1 hypothetical protein SAMD00019534_094260 [Acytostelium subglobosum LB1]|eukprot:XP_012750805.1 hypothetical protein SAMD00019534_094260 [Acytostelium subglobosum LB1]